MLLPRLRLGSWHVVRRLPMGPGRLRLVSSGLQCPPWALLHSVQCGTCAHRDRNPIIAIRPFLVPLLRSV